MFASLGARRRLKTIRTRFAISVLALIVGPIFCYFCYIFEWRYDVPFRVAGHYEKGGGDANDLFTVSPISNTLVYSTTATGHGDIWSIDLVGQNSKRMTSNPEYEATPCYSPDGRHIVFSRETDKCGHLWIMNADGTGATQLTSGPDYDDNPVFTPDGQHIWFRRVPCGTMIGSTMFTMTSIGKDIRPLDVNVSDMGLPCFAPDGKWVYFTRTDFNDPANFYQLWRMRPDGTDQQSLANGLEPAVSPDSSEVAFVPGNSQNELWLMDADGSRKRLVYHSNSGKRHIVFAEDGRSLFFSEDTTKGSVISSVKLDGSAYRQVKDAIPVKK